MTHQCIVIGVCVLHGNSYLSMSDYLLDGSNRNVLIDKPCSASVTCDMSGNPFSYAHIIAKLLDITIELPVNSCTEKHIEIFLVLVV